jgi:hypothetical protein
MTVSKANNGLPLAPTSEVGKAVRSTYDFVGLMPWGQWIDDVERAPDLRWPVSVQVYDQMRNDSQCQGLYLGATAAILRYLWYIDPNGCDPAWVDLLAADLNLPVGLDQAMEQAERGILRGTFKTAERAAWYPHLDTALTSMKYGHYYFEQVGEITNDGPGGAEMWRLRKLSPRHPRTITEFIVNQKGELLAICQGFATYDPRTRPPAEFAPFDPISADRLVWYLWDSEPGDWVGRSIYRPMYRNWLIKDRLLRVDAIKHERNGVGMPIINAPEGATNPQMQDLDRMAQEYKVGERGGGAIPFGAKLTLVGTSGTLPDTIASIRMQNEEMAKSLLMMFMQLGQTETGSRALGRSFIDWFTLAQEIIANWVANVGNEQIVSDWWGWNVDPEADTIPLIAWHRPPAEGANTGDFRNINSPEMDQKALEKEGERQNEKTPTSQAKGSRRVPQRARTGDPSSPGGAAPSDGHVLGPAPTSAVASDVLSAAGVALQTLRRQPFANEIHAAADFVGLDTLWNIYADNLLHYWKTEVQPAQLAQINSSIAAMSPTDLSSLAGLSVDVVGADRMYEILRQAADEASAAAVAEVISQGETPPSLSWDKIEADLVSRSKAMSGLLAQTLGDTAGRYAMRRSNASTTSQEIADGVVQDLNQLTDAWLRDQLGGVVQAAVNQSRLEVYSSTDDEPDLWASEILDRNTCRNCAAIDGQRLDSASAARLYASGGYINCLGHERCRGTVVATYGIVEGF